MLGGRGGLCGRIEREIVVPYLLDLMGVERGVVIDICLGQAGMRRSSVQMCLYFRPHEAAQSKDRPCLYARSVFDMV